jgi:hypothetical protein
MDFAAKLDSLECVVMHLTYLIHSRVWVILVALAISRLLYSSVPLSRGSHKNRLDSTNSTVSWIEGPLLSSGNRLSNREHAPGLSTQNEAPSGRAGYDLPRLLLRRYGAWAARSSG